MTTLGFRFVLVPFCGVALRVFSALGASRPTAPPSPGRIGYSQFSYFVPEVGLSQLHTWPADQE